MDAKVQVLVASEDASCLNLLALVLQNQKHIVLIGEAANWRELSSLVSTLKPDVVLLDTDAPGNGAAAVIRTAKLKRIHTAFIGLVGELDVDGTLLNQLDALVLKSDPLHEITSAILAMASVGNSTPKGLETGFFPTSSNSIRGQAAPEATQATPPLGKSHHLAGNPPEAQDTMNGNPGIIPSATPEIKPQTPNISPKETDPWQMASQSGTAPVPESKPFPINNEKPAQIQLHEIDHIGRANLDTSLQPQHRDTNGNGHTVLTDPIYIIPGAGNTASAAPQPSTQIRSSGPTAAEAVDTTELERPSQGIAGSHSAEIERYVDPNGDLGPQVSPQTDGGIEPTMREVLPSAGSIVLVVSPFANFRMLGSFQQALEKLEGVRSVRVRRFQGGTLYAAVRYTGTSAQLEEQLKDLVQFDPRIIDSKPGIIELRINGGPEKIRAEIGAR